VGPSTTLDQSIEVEIRAVTGIARLREAQSGYTINSEVTGTGAVYTAHLWDSRKTVLWELPKSPNIFIVLARA
jgi:hypothetical protein